MALERSTKTIQDLIKFADDKMQAGFEQLHKEDPGIFYGGVGNLAVNYKLACKKDFPGILHECNQHNLLLQSGFARLSVTTTEIGHSFRPDWAIWLSVHEYLEEHGEWWWL